MIEGTIKFSGKTMEDVQLAISTAASGINEDYTTGADSNDSGSYSFDVSGEED